jgi:hypothetical protein
MCPVSSVTAFLARFGCEPDGDPEAQAICAALAPADREVLQLLAREPDPDARARRLAAAAGVAPSLARLLHTEQLALTALRRLLAARGLLLD